MPTMATPEMTKSSTFLFCFLLLILIGHDLADHSHSGVLDGSVYAVFDAWDHKNIYQMCMQITWRGLPVINKLESVYIILYYIIK